MSTLYSNIQAMGQRARRDLEEEIARVEKLEDDPRLRQGFCFYGRYFHNYAQVEAVDLEHNKVSVRVYYGTQGSSFLEDGWDLHHYLHGFDDSSYLPCVVQGSLETA